MNNQARFRELFLELENLTLNKNDSSFDNESFYSRVNELKRKRIYPYYSEYDFIDFCREYRNALSHQVLENRYLDFNDACIVRLENIVETVRHPEKVLEKANRSIYSVELSAKVKETLLKMAENNYTYIPIYENNRLVGIFSDEVLSELNLNGISIENTVFADIQDYIDPDRAKEKLVFVSKNTSITEAVEAFFHDFDHNEKTHCVFITEHGKKNEKILGLFTAWDIIRLFRRPE